MHQIAFGGRAPPGPVGAAYSAPPEPLAGLREPTSNGRDGEGVEGREKRGEEGRKGMGKGREGEGRGREGQWRAPLWIL